MTTPAERLTSLGLILPTPAAPVGSYAPYVVLGNQVVISGQLPLENGSVVVTGRLGAEVDVATGQKAARLCALNLLGQLRAACGGDLERVERCVRLGGFVASAPNFFDQAKVMNGASDLMLAVLGEEGRHARAAVGVPCLPLNAAVEVEGVFTLKTVPSGR